MDKASDYESGDSRFESWRGRLFFIRVKPKLLAQMIKVDLFKIIIGIPNGHKPG